MTGGVDGPDAAGRPDAGTWSLLGALEVLRARLSALGLPLDTPDATAGRADRSALLDQLDDYLLPRLRVQGAPLLVVVGGSTGAGKSTLVSSIVGESVTAAGVLRPTTRAPVLVHHPSDAGWFAADRVLPGLTRVIGDPAPGTGPADAGGLHLVARDNVPRGLALLDAPDVDSVVVENRRLAAQLLAAADLWLFVTTAARYADAVPWGFLGVAARRHAQVALVLDRADRGTEELVAADLARLAQAEGLVPARTFVVPEAELAAGLLPERAVAPISRWLTHLATDRGARELTVLTTRDGAVDDAVRRAQVVARAAAQQEAATDRLRGLVSAAYDDAARHVHAATSDGSLLRGEVLTRWQELAGTGELFAGMQRAAGRARDRVAGFFRGRSTAVPELGTAIEHGLEALLIDAAEAAGERARQAWRLDPAGRPLLAAGLGAAAAPEHEALRGDVSEEVRGWQDDVVRLVRDQGESKRATARALSLGVNGAGAVLMLAVFASTAGLTGAEIGIAGGTAAASQAVLSAVFGDEAVRQLTREARESLDRRTRTVLDAQAARQLELLEPAAATPGEAERLRRAAQDVQDVSAAERRDRAPVAPQAVAADTGRLRGALLPPDVPGPASNGASEVAQGSDDARAGFWRRVLRRGRS